MVNRIQPYEFKSTESELPLFVKDYRPELYMDR